MFKTFADRIDILGICVDEPLQLGGFSPIAFYAAYDGRNALEMIRLMRFDLLMVGSRLPDMSMVGFIQTIRSVRPTQNWAMVGPKLEEKQKTFGRMYGAETFFDTMPSVKELANMVAGLRERAIAAVLNGRFDRPAQYRMAG